MRIVSENCVTLSMERSRKGRPCWFILTISWRSGS